eukprot:TRINITY_DN629_c0_g2_i1.p1 TRINITY_DN629_c0_g2~~TRINITY_DN629_c0_g2_i1.p1  ORF type:complete len:421 (+),score=72.06 TRINITY_DN629_c0_g2_i1:56-1318(+)
MAPVDSTKISVKTAQDEAECVAELDWEKFGVAVPAVPGDIMLSGNMPQEVVAEMAKRCKGWLSVNKEDDPNIFRETIEAAGATFAVLPLYPPQVPEGRAEELKKAIDTLPRPLMIQCKSGNRAGAALLLWLANKRGYSAQSAVQLAVDLDLKFYTNCANCGDTREWLFSQMPTTTSDPQVVASPAELSEAVVHQLFDTDTSTLTYLVGCRKTGEAVLIDPVLEQQDRDLSTLDELGFKLKYVINTHCHADHVTSGGAIRKVRPDVKTIISKDSGAKADMHVQDGDKISFGNLGLEVRAVPGHTDGCVAFLLRSDAKPMVFTGDALLIRGCGRCDFQQGDAGKLYDSVHSQLFSLPAETLIYPGHDYKGRSVSTVEEEKQFNPRLTKRRDEFVELMANLGLPYPKRIDVAVPANMVCGVQD